MNYNIAFIDGQKILLPSRVTNSIGKKTTKNSEFFNSKIFSNRSLLFFPGYIMEENTNLYYALQKSGFIVSFREHSQAMAGKKKRKC